MTFGLNSGRSRGMAFGLIIVMLAGVLLGWIAWQNHQYSERLLHAGESVARKMDDQPTGLKEKEAVVAQQLPGIVLSVRIPRIIYEVSLVPNIRSELDATREVKAPFLWRSRHAKLVKFNLRALERAELEYERLVYVDQLLGDAPTAKQIAALPTDPRYVELGREIRSATTGVAAAADALEEADPYVAGMLPWSVDIDLQEDWDTGKMLDQAVSRASVCALTKNARAASPDCIHTLRYVEDSEKASDRPFVRSGAANAADTIPPVAVGAMTQALIL